MGAKACDGTYEHLIYALNSRSDQTKVVKKLRG